jgi:ABC-type transporter Mla subunit MlaD
VRLPVLTPSDVVSAARALSAAATTLGTAVTALADLAPRLQHTVDRAARLLDDLERRRPQVEDVAVEVGRAIPPIATAAPAVPGWSRTLSTSRRRCAQRPMTRAPARSRRC